MKEVLFFKYKEYVAKNSLIVILFLLGYEVSNEIRCIPAVTCLLPIPKPSRGYCAIFNHHEAVLSLAISARRYKVLFSLADIRCRSDP